MALVPVEEALTRILKGAKPLPAETIKLQDGLGRILAADIVARRDQPPFYASAMDGYAVRHEDLNQVPVTLKLIGASGAGHGFTGMLKQGQAVRILTGAPMPKGADTIVIQEVTRIVKGGVEVLDAPAPGRNIRVRGLDFKKAEVLVPAGTKLTARDLGLAAAGNAAMIRVRKKPRVAILTTGDELAAIGTAPRWDQITSSNNQALSALVTAMGAEAIDFGVVRDDLKATTAAVKKAFNADILVTTGGASVGDHDFVQEALKRAGVKIDFWKIALRPGKPFMFGTKGKLRVLGMPGNPVSAIMCSLVFLKPLLHVMDGLPPDTGFGTARLAIDLPANDHRQDYMRARISNADDGTLLVTPATKQDSSMQRVMREADCMVVRPPHAPALEAGALVPILRFPAGI
ncbi:molybdopterin molybdotransferase MoeA [Aestuariivirga litoralis]|uniref:molybdopterin molybdotransferase MoeA n=1 Tax=Aestuariivirga litoralis TaxID=2650924 RepID=UPI001AEDF9BA|nr:gephyrin-like molybdotransferase Glp [Aestuariivirga litoralis]